MKWNHKTLCGSTVNNICKVFKAQTLNIVFQNLWQYYIGKLERRKASVAG